VNIKEVINLIDGVLRIKRRRRGKVDSRVVIIDALRRFNVSERSLRSVPYIEKRRGSIVTKDKKV
jgi:hypothetical protein